MKVRIEDTGYAARTIVPYYTEAPDQIAQFAMELLRSHANVAGHQDGEDSTGRAKLRLQAVDELVTRSFDIAELAFKVAAERGHIVTCPDLNEINADYDAERKVERESLSAEKVANLKARQARTARSLSEAG